MSRVIHTTVPKCKTLGESHQSQPIKSMISFDAYLARSPIYASNPPRKEGTAFVIRALVIFVHTKDGSYALIPPNEPVPASMMIAIHFAAISHPFNPHDCE
eukprot:826317_1